MRTKAVTTTDEDPIVVTVDELAGRLGGLPEYVYSSLKRLNLKLVEGHVFDADPADPPVEGLPIAEAEVFLREVRADGDAHNARWRAYVAYRDRRKREAAEECQRQATEARRQAMEEARRSAAMYQQQEAERLAEEAALAAAQQAEREGCPVSFDEFVSTGMAPG